VDSKLVHNSTGKPFESPVSSNAIGDSTDVEIVRPASQTSTVHEDETIRPFVYRAPVGKASKSEPSHPGRRVSDIEFKR